MTSLDIQPTQPDHAPALRAMLDATQLFPAEMLEDLMQDGLWLTALLDSRAVGLSYCVPEEMTDGTWNMRALGVHPEAHRRGVARALVAETEAALRAQGHRLLIVDTSGTEDFAAAPAFYDAAGYSLEARLRDFWAEGDDKITFRKAL